MNIQLDKRVRHMSPSAKAVLIFIIFCTLAILLPVHTSALDVAGVLGATSIFYSILLGFYISAAMSNLGRLKTLTATETGALIAIHRIILLSLPDRADETVEAIDKYLIKRFDYEVNDYTEPTTVEFFAIFDVLKDSETKSEGQRSALNFVAEAMYYISHTRREITIVGARILTVASWLILIILSLIVVFLLFIMRDGSIESAIVTTLLATSAVMALFILQDVDGNRLGEEEFSIGTYQDVFSAIGKLHYYPTIYTEAGRFKPSVKEYRTGTSMDVKLVKTDKVERIKIESPL